jgi:signal transduction histidine kinase
MRLRNRSPLFYIGVTASATLALILLIWPGWNELFSSRFMPHGHCYLWIPALVRLHMWSDILIGTSYVAISATLALLVHRARRDIPFSWMFLAFGGFIITCGATHFMAVWTIWHGTYWLSGQVKLVTAVASVLTALALPPLIPRALTMIREAKVSLQRKQELELANDELTALNERISQLDELKSQFFANVSHELRTPLSLILGPLDSLLRSEAIPDADREKLEMVKRNASLLLKHVNDLLDVARIEAGRMEIDRQAIDMASLVRRTISNFDTVADVRGIELQVDTPPSAGCVADADMMERVLLNLLSNAFKFVPDGGTVLCTLRERGESLQLVIEDSGPGIPVAMRDAVFERFRQVDGGSTRQSGGTGLGLAIVKDLVELHEGKVSVDESSLGGARFTVVLPRGKQSEMAGGAAAPEDDDRPPGDSYANSVAAELLPAAPAPRAVGETDGRPSVLIAEDNAEMRRFIADSLAPAYAVSTASNGREALEAAVALIPDLIITDLMMPELDGAQLVAAVREQPALSGTPLVVLSARADDQVVVDLLRGGAQDYLLKPFRVEELRARVSNLLAIKQARDVLQSELQSRTGDIGALGEELRQTFVSLRQTETQLREALDAAEAANRSKDEFLATLSHELRTPLTAIKGWTALLRTGELGPDDTLEAVETIERSTDMQIRLVEDILDVSRLVAGKLTVSREPLDLIPIVRDAVEAVRPAAGAKDIALNVDIRRQSVQVAGDGDRLQQIIWNLLSNGIRFTPPGGMVSIVLDEDERSARIIVSDSGIGIDPEFLPHVFEPFRQADASFTRSHSGLGLGLAIVRNLVELHGGEIRAESAGAGQGATFTVLLPLLAGGSLEEP